MGIWNQLIDLGVRHLNCALVNHSFRRLPRRLRNHLPCHWKATLISFVSVFSWRELDKIWRSDGGWKFSWSVCACWPGNTVSLNSHYSVKKGNSFNSVCFAGFRKSNTIRKFEKINFEKWCYTPFLTCRLIYIYIFILTPFFLQFI